MRETRFVSVGANLQRKTFQRAIVHLSWSCTETFTESSLVPCAPKLASGLFEKAFRHFGTSFVRRFAGHRTNRWLIVTGCPLYCDFSATLAQNPINRDYVGWSIFTWKYKSNARKFSIDLTEWSSKRDRVELKSNTNVYRLPSVLWD